MGADIATVSGGMAPVKGIPSTLRTGVVKSPPAQDGNRKVAIRVPHVPVPSS
jgi:hypothetical protein